MKNQRGFTLVELMIVVAIIGILASIAVPNYQKYQAKARQSEVKLSLSGAYTALQSFMAENSSYTECLSNIGVSVTNQSKQFYTFGFNKAATLCWTDGTKSCEAYSWDATGAAQGQCANATTTAGSGFFAAGAKMGGNIQTTLAGNYGITTQTRFTLGAEGFVSSSGVVDTWTMDEAKSLINTNSGI